MIAFLWQRTQELIEYIVGIYHPVWDTLDILIIAVAVYWLLLLIRGTRAVQMLIGLLVLIAARLVADFGQLATVDLILEVLLEPAVIIIIVLFQAEIRRALARMGRGVFVGGARRQETQILEEIVRASQTLAQKRVGALIVLERETALDDLIEAGITLDSRISKELLTSIFLPYSPLHDGAVVVQSGRIAHAGCVLPLTLRSDLPEGVGTRHRAAVGITEESDAVVVVVSEETATISVVTHGEMSRDLDAPRLRAVLRDLLTGSREAADSPEERVAESGGSEAARQAS